MRNILDKAIKKVFGSEIKSIEKVGGGMAGGVVYKLELSSEPFVVAVKTAKNQELLKEECEYIDYISTRVDIKLPKIFYYECDDKHNFVIMEFFDGVNCADKYVLNTNKANRLKIASQVADLVIKLQSVKGDKFGNILSPTFDTWNEYYKCFVDKVMNECDNLLKSKLINKYIYDTLLSAYKKFDIIFSESTKYSTMIHGDLWAQNIIVDKDYNVIGIVDPFNCLWGDSEYELFALNAIYGKKIPILESYLEKQSVSKMFFVKNAFYVLFSEVYWVVKLHHNNKSYLNSLSYNLRKQLRKFKI